MPTSFEQFAADYLDLANDVINSGYETYQTKLTDWFDFIEREPISNDRIANLQHGFDFDEWYDPAKATVGSMVGSGRLDWAKDRTERLGRKRRREHTGRGAFGGGLGQAATAAGLGA